MHPGYTVPLQGMHSVAYCLMFCTDQTQRGQGSRDFPPITFYGLLYQARPTDAFTAGGTPAGPRATCPSPCSARGPRRSRSRPRRGCSGSWSRPRSRPARRARPHRRPPPRRCGARPTSRCLRWDTQRTRPRSAAQARTRAPRCCTYKCAPAPCPCRCKPATPHQGSVTPRAHPRQPARRPGPLQRPRKLGALS
jgi:hypothetical protein